MRKFILIFTAIILSLAAVSCNEKVEDPYQDYVPSTAATTAADDNPAETVPEKQDVSVMLPAIIENLKRPLIIAKSEYDEFLIAIDSVKNYLNDPTDENLSAAMKDCNTLNEIFIGAPEITSNLKENENAAILELGMLDESYNNVFNNCAMLRTMKMSILSGVVKALDDLEAFGYDLNFVIDFYLNYTELFQMNLYYNINTIINECTAESESITEFKTNFHPELIGRFSDTMKWEDDNEKLVELCEALSIELETIVTEFEEQNSISGDEGNE